MKRTVAEKERMIQLLKKQKEALPEYNVFGDNNHLILDYQMDVIEGKLSDQDEVYKLEEDGDIDDSQASDICMAFDWLDGDIEEDELVDDTVITMFDANGK